MNNNLMNDDVIEIEKLKLTFSKSLDVIFRELKINNNVTAHLVFVDGLVDQSRLSEYVLRPILVNQRLVESKDGNQLVQRIREGLVYYPSISETYSLQKLTDDLLLGNAIIIINDEKVAFLFDVKGFEMRGVSEPTEEMSLKGSKEGFIEVVRINTSIVRRKLRSNDLVIEHVTVGSASKTIICVCYLSNLVTPGLVNEIIRRLNSIEEKQVFYTSIVEENIIDYKHTPFPQVEYTEKPTKFCAALLEGRVGILIDGIPFSMVIPTSVVNFFQTTDDYDYNYIVMSLIRIIRYGLCGIALILPSFYVSVTSFHPQMVPESLLLSIAASEKGVPLPIYLECFILIFAFQTLIEAGTRMWSTIAGIVSLVGALIVGEAAINANLVSPGVLVVVAASSIGNFTIPNKDFAYAIWIWGFILLMLSSIVGLFGLTIGSILLIHHLSQMEILGEPYLMPFVGTDGKNLHDTIIKSKEVFKKKKTIHQQIKDI